MDRVPFSAYDFFGHLAAGVVLIASIAYVVMGPDVLHHGLTLTEAVVLVIGCYVAGHVIASFSSFTLERHFTRKLLGSPTEALFSRRRLEGWRRLFAGYLSPLPESTIERVLSKSRTTMAVAEPGEALFYHCFGVVRQHEYPRERLATFLNLYGFARNMSFTFLACAVVFLVGASASSDSAPVHPLVFAAVAVGVSTVLFLRYLKFYRLYSVELYVWYAELV